MCVSRGRTVWPLLCQAFTNLQNLLTFTLLGMAPIFVDDAETTHELLSAVKENLNIREVRLVLVYVPSVSLVEARSAVDYFCSV